MQCGFQSGFFCDLGVDRAPGRDAWMWKSLSFRCPGGGLRPSFWEAFGDPGVTLSGFFRVPERGWNFDGHRGDQTWMTGSALRRGTFWLNTIVSKGRRVWEEGG